MAPSEAAKKAFEDEDPRLKKLLGEAMLDVASPKDILGENWRGPSSVGRWRFARWGSAAVPSGGPATWP